VYFEQVIRFFGLCPRVEIEGIKLIPADAEASARLSLRPGEKIVQVRKMFYGDEHLAVHNVMIIPARYVKKEDLEIYRLPRDAIWEMVDRIASRKGVSRLECEIMQISATNCARTPELLPYMHEEEADIHPFIVLQTVFRDVNQEPLLFSTCYINADIITFGAILSPPRE
jgi:DNA-binding GntR family transcriptional regulator